MLHDSTPPLLRGLGTTLILIATIISFVVARQEARADAQRRAPMGQVIPASPKSANAADDDSLLEEVFANPWFEGLSYVGTSLIATSFYLEWYMRRRPRKG